MRRLSVILVALAALAAPTAVLAGSLAADDGSLVVRHGQAPAGTPVVALTVTGSVIGNVDHGKIVIDAGPNTDASKAPVVTPNANCVRKEGETVQRCTGDNFSFRAAGGKYVVFVYGSNVNLVAVGTGTAKVAGMPDTPSGDGRYSLNGNDFVSLPGAQTDKLTLTSNG